MDYTVNPETGLLEPEYVDVYGIPFSVIPFKGRAVGKPTPVDKPKNHVKSLPERSEFQIMFPNVEGYAFELKRNSIKADIPAMLALDIEPTKEPTALFVKPSVGYSQGSMATSGPGAFEKQDREEFYRSTHLQTIEFAVARQVVAALVGDGYTQPKGSPRLRLQARHQLFPQVLRLVHDYVRRRVNFHGVNPCELGMDKYVQRVVELMVAAIEPDESSGEPPLIPIVNRYKPFLSTEDVGFKTTCPTQATVKSQIDQVVLHSTWEGAAATTMDGMDIVQAYARNEQLGLGIAYEFQGVDHVYEPDFLVRLSDKRMIILEMKGERSAQNQAKFQAAQRWASAVNNCDKLGCWKFIVCYDPNELGRQLVEATKPW